MLGVKTAHDLGRAAASEQLGEILACCRIAADCVVLLGWSSEPFPREGVVERGNAGEGRFLTAAIGGGALDRPYFIAVARAPRIAEPGATIRLLGVGRKTPTFALLPETSLDAGTFVLELSRRLGPGIQEAARFFLASFGKSSRQLEGVNVFLAALLDAASDEDGVIEILAPVEGEGVLAQGWMRAARAGELHVLAHGDAFEERQAVCATFERTDLEAPAQGVVILMRGEPAAVGIKRIHLHLNGRLLRLSVLPEVARLKPDDAPNHLRDMLPRLRGDAAIAPLKAAARPRYAGQDTIHTLDRPVRMAVDLAARLPGAGVYLAGWLLDPTAQASSVWLCGGRGRRERIEPRLVRVPREDVSAAFSQDPLFRGRLSGNRHGFCAFLPDADRWGALWIEIEFGDGHFAFLPIAHETVHSPEVRERIHGSVDLHKPSAAEIVEHCLGPLFLAEGEAEGVPAPGRFARPMPSGGAAALIVPVTAPETRLNTLVAGIAARPPGPEIPVLFVCTPAAVGDGGYLARNIAFYGLEAGILLLERDVGFLDALAAGIQAAAQAQAFLVMSPTTHPLSRNWGSTLLAAVEDFGRPLAASPTLLYEDWSVRYAGIDRLRFSEAAPYAESEVHAAGYPRDGRSGMAGDAGAQETLAAAIECCAFTRAAWTLAGGARRGYAAAWAGGLDLFLRLKAAGGRVLWIPGTEAYALDDGGARSDAARTAELVDGWILRARWRPGVSGPGQTEPKRDRAMNDVVGKRRCPPPTHNVPSRPIEGLQN